MFTAVTVLGFECQTYNALSLIFMAGETPLAGKSSALPTAPRSRRQAKPPQVGNTSQNVLLHTALSTGLPQVPISCFPFKKPGLHWSQVPAVPLTGDTSPWRGWQRHRSPAAPRGADVPRHRELCWGLGHKVHLHNPKGLWHLERPFYLLGTKAGLSVCPVKRKGSFFSANSLAGPAVVFPPVCPLLPWQLTHHSIANSTEMGLEQNEASHTMFSYCCRTGCGTRLEQHQGQCWRTDQGPSTPAREGEGPDLEPLACRHTALGGIKYLQHCSRGIYIYGYICICGGLAAELH